MKHTPGPWKMSIHPEGGHNEFVNTYVKVSIPTFGTHIQSAVFLSKHGSLQDESDRANAKLIAAAPDLLECLKSAISILKTGYVKSEISSDLERFENVIAMAEGK